MTFLELRDSNSRFRFSQSCVGLAGCLCVCYAVWTPFWLKDRGLWTAGNNTKSDQTSSRDGILFNVLEAERVFGVLSFLMASVLVLCVWCSPSAGDLRRCTPTPTRAPSSWQNRPSTPQRSCCSHWPPQDSVSSSAGLSLPISTGKKDFSSLGSSYWLGALGWVLLLVLETIIFVAEQAVVPDILPDLERAVESVRISHPTKAALRSCSDGYYPCNSKRNMAPKSLG
ncbi:uncharacterized protein LOC120812821 [Gasterosteus aculeatus]